MTRVVEEQVKANPKIAGRGTHSKGEAIDFAARFMLKYFPDDAEVLRRVLNEMQNQGRINFLNEENSTSFWHVSRRVVSDRFQTPKGRTCGLPGRSGSLASPV